MERRRVQRTRVLKAAKSLLMNNSTSLLDCSVRNLTNLGACLQISSPLGIPQQFDVTFDYARTRRPCRVIWQTSKQLGVEFA
jgi:PilZ domain